MKKLLWGAVLLAMTIATPVTAMGGVTVQIGIPLPPPIVLPGPPEVILLPQTGVYVAPDVVVDLFFFDGWWWRPWEGRWYRSRDYRSGWVYYNAVPSFYGRVPSGWREEYRAHRWHGQEWHYQRVTHPELRQIHQRNVREESRIQDRARFQQERSQAHVGQQHWGPEHSQSPHGRSERRG